MKNEIRFAILGLLCMMLHQGISAQGTDQCHDCPIGFNYKQTSTGSYLELKFSQYPSWINTMSPAYYISATGQTYGPFNVTPQVSGTVYNVHNFPSALCCPLTGGSFILGGGAIRCNYIEGALSSCTASNPDCTCPKIQPQPEAPEPGIIKFRFTNPPNDVPSPYTPTVSLTLNWNGNTLGPITTTWPTGNTVIWGIALNGLTPFPPPTYLPPYTGELIINNEYKCIYQDHIPIACETVPAISSDCKFSDCISQLEEFILNLPGSGCAKWETDCNTTSPLFRYGKVRIGNAPVPDGYNLAVDGGIMTSEVKVQLCNSGGWCDYVFADSYKLPGLYEVEEFIKANGHLPRTPSNKDVIEDGGLELKTTMLNQQEKVEELFLYLIQVQEDIQQLKKEAEKIERENQAIRNIVFNNKK